MVKKPKRGQRADTPLAPTKYDGPVGRSLKELDKYDGPQGPNRNKVPIIKSPQSKAAIKAARNNW